jgi:diadenosine tetraphosphatase ApaH/serine/threonine PP2A family protein phosphatase
LVIDIERSLIDVNIHDFIQTIDDATKILENERQTGSIIGGKVNGGFIELQIPEKLAIIGDIHGDLKSFIKVLYDIHFEEFLVNPNNKVIFLGDYVDRGSNSIDVLYYVCYLKRQYPNSIILMRGNHEAPVEFPFFPHDLPDKIIERYGICWGKLIYIKKILRFFRLLTLATLIQNQLFIVHGGLPTEDGSTIDFKRSLASAQENHIHDRILEEILWNDPLRSPDRRDWIHSKRGFGRLFGINISRKWLNVSGTKVVIRGHEPCQGFKIDHDGMVATLFSCREAYPNFEASYIMISIKELQSIHDGVDLSHYVIHIS